jgi:hypothetical protein
MKRLLPRLSCVAGMAACLAAPDTFATNDREPVSSGHQETTHAPGVKHEAKGHVATNPKAKQEFMQATGYPQGRPGYVVNYIVPLKQGGANEPGNMEWQPKAAAKTKDKTK